MAYLVFYYALMFRRYFVEEMHYVIHSPSGRAAAEVLMSNEGSKAKSDVRFWPYCSRIDFILKQPWLVGRGQSVQLPFKWGAASADQTKLTAAVDTDAALLGLGYFTGLRYAAIIAAGSFFSWFVCIPIE